MDTNYPNKLDNTLTKRLICKIALSLLTIILLTAPQLYGQNNFTATCYYGIDNSDIYYDYSYSITKYFTSLEEAMSPANYYDEENNRYARVVYIKQNSDSYNLNNKIDNIGRIGDQVGNVKKYILELKTINCSGDAEIVVNDADVYLNNITANGLVKFKMDWGNPIYICGGNFNGGVEINGPESSQFIYNVNAYIFGGSFKGTDYAIRTIDNVNLYIENSQRKNGSLVSPTFTATNGPALINNNSTGMVYIYGGKFTGSNGNSAIISKQNTKVLDSQTGLKLLDESDVPHEEQYKNNNNYYELCDENNNKLNKVTVAGSYLEFNNNDGSLTFKYGERLRGWRAWNKLIQSTAREVFDLDYLNNLPPENGIYFDINDIEKENNRDKKNSSGNIEWSWEVVKKVQFDYGYTSNVHPTSCAYWFKDFTSLKTIDLSSIDMSKVTNMTEMFYGCNNLSTILVSLDWIDWIQNRTILGDNMFDGCTEIIGDKGTTYNASNANDISFAIIDSTDNKPGYLTTGKYKLFYKWADVDNKYQKYDPISYEYSSETLNIKNPTRENFDFSHWTCKPAIGGVSTKSTTISIEPFSEGNRIYTMNWTVKTYPVTLPEHMEFVTPSTEGNIFACDSIVTFKAKDGYKVTEGPEITNPKLEKNIISEDANIKYQYSFTMPSAPGGVKIEATVVEKVQLQIKPSLSDNDKHISFPTDWKQFCKKEETEAILKYRLSDGSGVPTNCNIIIETIEGSVNYETQNGEVHISTLPTSLGKYNCSAVFVGDEESTTPSDTIKFTLEITAAHGLILQLYQNVIFVDNSSEKFETYQWYRYGEETDEKLNNGSRQYFTEPTLKGSYWALLNGNIYACPWTTPSTAKIAASIVKTYPNPAISGQPFRLEVSEFNPDTENRLVIFNSNGVIVAEMILESASVDLSLPQGIYSGAVISNGEKTSFKMMVR